MNVWSLPTSLTVGGVGFSIRTDFRVILDLLSNLTDPQFEDDEKALIMLKTIYIDSDKIPPENQAEAIERAVEFIDVGISNDKRDKPSTMDWEQDAPIIIPAVNRVMGCEIRAMENLHWWTFIGAYMEIGQSLFSSVVQIREKKAKGKKLEKEEQEFYRENRVLIDLHRKDDKLSDEQKNELRELFGYKKKR